MTNPTNRPTQPVAMPRKPYHAPRLNDYGAVSQLTQATPAGYGIDSGLYTSQPA